MTGIIMVRRHGDGLLHRAHDRHRCRQVGIADAEMDDVYAIFARTPRLYGSAR